MDVFDLFAKISLDTSEYERGLDGASGKTRSFADKLKNGFSTIAKVGAVALTATTTAVAAFAKSSVDAGMAFDESMSKVAAISGATGSDFDALREKAMEMGASTKFSATESADAFTYMAMAGWKTEDMLNGIEGIMNLAAASGEDLATTSDIVTDALTAFGLSAKDSGHFADVLAVAATNANTDVGMMGETFKYVAPVAGSLGYSIEDASLAIGLMANSSIKASQAGTSLRAIITRLATNAGASSKSMGALDVLTQTLGVSFYDAEGKARDLNAVLMEARDAWQSLGDEEATYYAKKIAGEEAISGWLAIMNASEEDVQKLSSALSDADGAALAMAETMQDNLAGDITKFKSAMEGAQIILSDQLTPSLREFVQFGTNAVSTLSTAFQEGGLSGAMETLGTILSDGLNMVIENLPKMVDAGMKLLGALGQGIIDNLPTIVSAAVDIVIMLVQGIIDALPRLASAAVEIIGSLARELVEATPQLLHSGMDMLIALVDGIMSGLPDMIARLPQIIEDFLNFITEELPSILDKGQDLMDSLVDGILNALPALLDAVPKIITSLVNFIGENLPKIVQAGINIQMKLIFGLLQAIPEFYKATPKIIGAIADGLLSLLGTVVDVGKNIVRGLWDGIVSMAGWIKDQVSNFFGGIVDGVKDLLGIHSPSKVFAGIGENMAAGLGKGWDNEFDTIKKDIENGLNFESSISASVNAGEGSSTDSNTLGGVSNVFHITVNGAQYQDEQSLARAIAQEIQYMTDRSRMTFA